MHGHGGIRTFAEKLSRRGVVTGLLLLVLFLFLMQVALAPRHLIKAYATRVAADTLFTAQSVIYPDHPELREQAREKIYREALLELASHDSIQLAVNMADSSVSLYLRGVRLHQTKFNSCDQDKLLGSLSTKEWAGVFSHPLEITRQHATIIKEPVVVREAPKDPEEASMYAWMPDTLIQNPAFLLLETEAGVHMVFEQDYDPAFRDHWKKFTFYSGLRFNKACKAAGAFFTFRKQPYYPALTIRLPADNLRAIYRALPAEAYVVFQATLR